MTSKLKKHSAKRSDDEGPDNFGGDDGMTPINDEPEMQESDPRWDVLKTIM
jgi:hypothetical protein